MVGSAPVPTRLVYSCSKVSTKIDSIELCNQSLSNRKELMSKINLMLSWISVGMVSTPVR